MEIAILFALIVLNGLFAMSELALVSARRARLLKLIDEGDSGAIAAAKLGEDPTRFLSTIQIGITSIGVLNGIVGESALAKPFGEWLTDATGVTHAGLPLANLAIGTNGGLSANSWEAPNGITGNVLLGQSLSTGGATISIAGSLTVGANEPSATTITRGGLKLDTTRLTRDQGYLPGGSCTSGATPQPVAMKWSRYL